MKQILTKDENKNKGISDEKNFNYSLSDFGNSWNRYANLNHLTYRNLNNYRNAPSFTLYTKEDIAGYIENPYRNQSQLRKAIVYIYGASSHFRRLIQYFSSLTDFSYVISPYRITPKKANAKTIESNYRKVMNVMSAFNPRTQFPKILTTCLKFDTFYGTLRVTNDNITIQQLPQDYCSISTIEGNVLNVTFNFSYFDLYNDLLDYYPDEFRKKYELYKSDISNMKWQELDSPTSFAIKCNDDILDYDLPPFAGLLREIYDIEDYKQLRSAKTELENYSLLSMQLPMDEDGNWGIDFKKAKDFWSNLDSVLPEQVGSVLTPMPIEKISFDQSGQDTDDKVAKAEQNLFTAAGVSSLLFNNEKASSNALLLSIKVDQALTYGIVKNIEDAINRYIQNYSYGKYFKITILDSSPFNRKEIGEQFLKGASYGLPMISMYAASQQLEQPELDTMAYLENEVLNLQSMFVPLQSSAHTSSSSKSQEDVESVSATEEGGAPRKGIGEISDSGEENQENGYDWG